MYITACWRIPHIIGTCGGSWRGLSRVSLTLHNGDRRNGIALFNGIDDHLPIASDLAKDRVLAVEPGGIDMGNKELRAIGVWPGVRHTQDAGTIMLQL